MSYVNLILNVNIDITISHIGSYISYNVLNNNRKNDECECLSMCMSYQIPCVIHIHFHLHLTLNTQLCCVDSRLRHCDLCVCDSRRPSQNTPNLNVNHNLAHRVLSLSRSRRDTGGTRAQVDARMHTRHTAHTPLNCSSLMPQAHGTSTGIRLVFTFSSVPAQHSALWCLESAVVTGAGAHCRTDCLIARSSHAHGLRDATPR